MTDLWPDDIRVVKVRAPVTILREQASLLGQRTKNVVTAEVRAEEIVFPGHFGFNFYIVGPALGNYRYKVFEISHGVELYPVTITLDPDIAREIDPTATEGLLGFEGDIYAASEEAFLKLLRGIFAAGKTRQVIEAILAQSGVEPGEGP